MAVLINGIDVPDYCYHCALCHESTHGDWKIIDWCMPLNREVSKPFEKNKDCPLIEVEEAPGGFDMPSEERDKYTSLFYAVKKKEQDRCSEAEREYQGKLNQLVKNVKAALEDTWANGLTPEEYFASFPMGVFSAEPEARCCCNELE